MLPNFHIFTKIIIFQVYLQLFRPAASSLWILWQGHVRNTLFIFASCEPLTYIVVQLWQNAAVELGRNKNSEMLRLSKLIQLTSQWYKSHILAQVLNISFHVLPQACFDKIWHIIWTYPLQFCQYQFLREIGKARKHKEGNNMIFQTAITIFDSNPQHCGKKEFIFILDILLT